MFVLDEETTVNYPTTVKVTLAFVDDGGYAISLISGSNIQIEITLNDNSGHIYECKYDTEDTANCEHMKLVPNIVDNNQLFLMLEGDYNLHGKIYATGKITLPDDDYMSNQDVSYYKCNYTNLKTVENGCEC